MKNNLIYLACPYSAEGIFAKLKMWWNYRLVTNCAGRLIKRGYNVFSPITHSHPIAAMSEVSAVDCSFWLGIDKWYVDRCDQMYVLNLYGWDTSVGVTREVDWAVQQNKRVTVVNMYGIPVRPLYSPFRNYGGLKAYESNKIN